MHISDKCRQKCIRTILKWKDIYPSPSKKKINKKITCVKKKKEDRLKPGPAPETSGFVSLHLPPPITSHNFRLRVIVHFLFPRWSIPTRQKKYRQKERMLTKFETKSARVKGTNYVFNGDLLCCMPRRYSNFGNANDLCSKLNRLKNLITLK